MRYRIEFAIADERDGMSEAAWAACVLEDLRRQLVETGKLSQRILHPGQDPQHAKRIGMALPTEIRHG